MADEARTLGDVVRDIVNIKVPEHLPTSRAIQQELRIIPANPTLGDVYRMLVLLAGELMNIDVRVHNLEYDAATKG